ncbi:hypothetical protein AAG570_002748 [Ranatra chinensis]|uniref:Uncharacterized protein n=1 Tax=Ranatra chinensis TaxID=642074 RepID=A0ABD0Y569_9HEMI
MASKRRNMFHKNKTQETTEKGLLVVRSAAQPLHCKHYSVSQKGGKLHVPFSAVSCVLFFWNIFRRFFQKNKTQETTENGMCNLPPFCDWNYGHSAAQVGIKETEGWNNILLCQRSILVGDFSADAPDYTQLGSETQRSEKLKIFSLGFNNTLVIYAEESEQYLCFNKKWKLIGTKNTSKHHCGFYEKMMDTGYFRYMSTANGSRYIGFNKKGRPLRNNNPVLQQQQRPRCYDFIKCDSKFSVEKHNAKKGGGTILNRTAEPLGTGKRRRQHPIRHHRHRQTT